MSLKLSDFETLKDLGSGSFGSVKLVRKKDDSQIFAMKTVSLGRLSQKEKDNALNEVRLLASIQIPNVIAYKASLFDQESNSLCIFMEYADGGDLQVLIWKLREKFRSTEAKKKLLALKKSMCGRLPMKSYRGSRFFMPTRSSTGTLRVPTFSSSTELLNWEI
jgi:NIMA (never in mitosis gene a)-related kinase